MIARTSGATMAHPKQDLHPVTPLGAEYHHHPRPGRKTQLSLRHRGQPVVTFADRAIAVPPVQARWRGTGFVAITIRIA